ncbi:MAG TPA: hypothetical protein VMB05_17260 [Solirubrobacteraceae bacterium]|nr:hypothetical protein [Solirubrobacteraceae bacterium]
MTHIKQTAKKIALAVVVLALAAAFTAPLASATPAGEATEWLASQLKSTPEGSYCEVFGEASVGETIECQLAFKTAGASFATQRKATYEWVLANKAKYIGTTPCETTKEKLSAGAVAKVALAVEAQGEDPRSVGSPARNLIADLECLQVASGTEAGRFSDKNTTDFSNVTTQSLALIALRSCEVNCSGKPSLQTWIKPGATYLRAQQCAGSKPKTLNGAFRSSMGLAASTCNSEPPFEPENPNAVEVDSTGAAAQALLVDGTGESGTAAESAVKWLKKAQAESGAWENYCDFTKPTVPFESVNSTALAVMAEVEGKFAFTKGQKWLTGIVEAQPKGEKGLPACTASGTPDVFATAQGIFGLFGTSYPRLVGLP